MSENSKKVMNPNRLGFLWFWLVWYAIGVFVFISLLLFTPPSAGADLLMNVNGMLFIVSMVLDSIVVLFILGRRKFTKWIVLTISLISFVPNVLQMIMEAPWYDSSDGKPPFWLYFTFNVLVGLIPEVIPSLYFFRSKRANLVLTRMFNDKTAVVRAEDEKFFNLAKLTFWRNVIMYFMAFAIVGHLLEFTYCGILRIFNPSSYDPHSEVWTTFILKPFLVYGAGAVACVLVFFPMRYLIARLVKFPTLVLPISFVVNASICTLLEYIMGVLMNPYSESGRRVLWDYSDQPFNFQGQICLTNAIAFGVVSTLITWVVYPRLEKAFIKIGHERMVVVSVTAIVAMGSIFAIFGVDSSGFIGDDSIEISGQISNGILER